MNFGVYCVRDSKVGFATPNVDSNDATAMRNFAFALSERNNTVMSFRKEDFDLFKLGVFDSVTGEIIPCSPTIVCSGASLEV